MTTAVVPTPDTAEPSLDAAEAALLFKLEETIERGLETFVDVGLALMEIRSKRLYREDYGTFEHYCRERWKFGDSRARQLIMAAETVTTVTDAGLPAPANERQARELVPLLDEPDKLRETWADAVDATDGKPTATAVRRAVRAVIEPAEPAPPADPKPTPAARSAASSRQPTTPRTADNPTGKTAIPTPPDDGFRSIDDAVDYLDTLRNHRGRKPEPEADVLLAANTWRLLELTIGLVPGLRASQKTIHPDLLADIAATYTKAIKRLEAAKAEIQDIKRNARTGK